MTDKNKISSSPARHYVPQSFDKTPSMTNLPPPSPYPAQHPSLRQLPRRDISEPAANVGTGWLARLPRLAFPMFCVVACAPALVVLAVPAALYAFDLPGLSVLTLGLIAIALTWGGLAILMRYQEYWESAPPPPQNPWTPPPPPFSDVALGLV